MPFRRINQRIGQIRQRSGQIGPLYRPLTGFRGASAGFAKYLLHLRCYCRYGRNRKKQPQGTGGDAAAVTGRLPVRGPLRDDHLCGQGQEPAQTGLLLFRAEQGAQRQSACAGAADRRDPPYRRQQRDRRAAARKFADKDPPAALQHSAQRRQDLSVDRGAARTFSARAVHPPADARRLAVFRSLQLGDDAAQRARIRARSGAAADVQAQSGARTDRQRQVFGLPAVSSGQLQGSLRRGAERSGVRKVGRYGRRGAQGRPAPRAELSGKRNVACRRRVEIRTGAAL